MFRTTMPRYAMLFLLFQTVASAQQNSAAPQRGPDPARIRSDIQYVENALPKVPDRAAALFMLARRYAQSGDLQKALSLLKECDSLDEGFDPSESLAFQSLRSFPDFRQLVDGVQRRHPSVHRARVAFTIPEKDLFPEGLAVDPERHVFYMGSMHRRKILKITESGEISDFVKPDLYNLMPVGGVHVDPDDHGLWAATDPGEADRSELLHFDAQGKLLERFPAPGPGPHDLNDLVLRNAQEIFVTDTEGQRVYRFDRASHQFTTLSFPRPLLYPNGITVSGDANLLYVADLFGVLQMDLRNNSVHEVNPGKGNTLAGIDGMYWYRGDLLGVQYGTGPFRVARFHLSPDGFRVTQTDVLEYRTPLLSDATTGAILGSNFYFIADTGIDNLHDNGRIIDPKKLAPVHIAVVPLK
jgi:hypothetical protein